MTFHDFINFSGKLPPCIKISLIQLNFQAAYKQPILNLATITKFCRFHGEAVLILKAIETSSI